MLVGLGVLGTVDKNLHKKLLWCGFLENHFQTWFFAKIPTYNAIVDVFLDGRELQVTLDVDRDIL